jgi:hypothetical protein
MFALFIIFNFLISLRLNDLFAAKVLHYTAISCQDVEKSGNKVNVF